MDKIIIGRYGRIRFTHAIGSVRILTYADSHIRSSTAEPGGDNA